MHCRAEEKSTDQRTSAGKQRRGSSSSGRKACARSIKHRGEAAAWGRRSSGRKAHAGGSSKPARRARVGQWAQRTSKRTTAIPAAARRAHGGGDQQAVAYGSNSSGRKTGT